ncbi:MAG TPA: hypothetical protein VKK79_19910, partial [Candidatus Lokiarchaeia archaeon]|nr:hypothetical protein [Candidatus Lokiarchaeia archaeon]
MGLWTETMVLEAIIGYCFVIANVSIGLYNIRDLNNMKGDITFVRAHKAIGRTETVFFYALMAQCLLMIALMIPGGFLDDDLYSLEEPIGIHAMFAMIVAFVLFTFKFVVARYKKDTIYKYGQYIGPIGFAGWSIAFWTALYDYYYYYAVEFVPPQYPFTFPNMLLAGIFPFPIGIAIFLGVLVRRGGTRKEKPFSVHQVAFILHGITFGYESAARELLGTPALLRYVVPRTS